MLPTQGRARNADLLIITIHIANKAMDPSRIDLNLLRVFHQLMQDRQVSRAASALGLTQPAVSNALRRMRTMLGDELFLRTPKGMQPTPYAMQLAVPIAEALGTLHGALQVRASFDPMQSDRCFAVAMTDVGQIYFLPGLMHALAQQAPRVTLRVATVADASIAPAMTSGQLDLAMGLFPQLQAGFYQQLLFRQPYVCLMRAGHALARRATITRAAFLDADHVRVEALGTGHRRVDDALAAQALHRRIRLTVPDYVALGHVLAQTDMLAAVPERFAACVLAPHGLVTRPLPVRLPGSHIHQTWHAHVHRDPGHRWLRHMVAQQFGAGGAEEKQRAPPLRPARKAHRHIVG